MTSDDMTDEVVARAAQRAARGPAPLIAALVAAWRSGFPDATATAALDCSQRTVDELALCRRPRAEQWLADVTELAQALQIDTDRLVAFLRAAESIERFSTAHRADDSQAGRLLAARDHERDE